MNAVAHLQQSRRINKNDEDIQLARWPLKSPTPQSPQARNTACLYRFGITVVLCLLFASVVPGGSVAAVLRSLLWMAAVVAAILGLIAREHPRAPTLTRWDEAAGHMALSLLLGFFTGSPEPAP